MITSDQIAAQTSAFQQQTMMQMQHAGMLSQFAGGAGPVAGQVAGGTINTMAAVGAPLMTGGMMLAGLDPISMGMRGAYAARGAGMMGMGAAGMGAAAIPMMGMMAAQYAGGQMMTGMREQQQLNSQLGAGFGHMNAYGGRGFARGEMTTIGSDLRNMTGQRGPGGEFATMDELSRLASNMGRMGMAQGVRDAKEFREKFSQMMTTVRQVAEEFSTSLEEAQKIMGSMRGAGVFGNAAQGQLSGLMRNAAVGGNVSMGTLSQMANVGSQISRSIGGRGRSGAVAGIEAAGTVGAAVRSGVLSEEDIYNTTGLTGEAGTQAMATNMLSINAKFLRGGLGRRVVAAMASKDGTIDEEMARAFKTGAVGTAETMEEAYGHLGKVGRANFMRNEGRLRGEAMRALGPLGVAQIAQGWMSNRGMDMNNMGDREMLFFQQKFGVDRDEADSLIKMARNLEGIKAQQAEGRFEDTAMRDIRNQRKTTGIEGVKRKFEDARQKVNNALREAGSGFLDSMTTMVERTINTVTGDYVRQLEQDVSGHVRDLQMGSGTAASREFGLGTGVSSQDKLKVIQEAYGLDMLGGDRWAKQNADVLNKAGYRFDKDGNAQTQLQEIRSIQAGVRTGGASIGDLSSRARGRLQSALAGLSGSGRERLAAFRKMDLSGEDFAGLRAAVSGAGSDAELARVYGSAASAAGFNAQERGAAFATGDTQGEFGLFDVKAEGDVGKALASYMLRTPQASQRARARPMAGMMGVYAPALPSARGVSGLSGAASGKLGELLEGADAAELAESALRGTEEERNSIAQRLNKERLALKDREKDWTASEEAQYTLKSWQAGALALGGGATDEEISSKAKELGINEEQFRRYTKTGQQALLYRRDLARRKQVSDQLAKEATRSLEGLGSEQQVRERLSAAGLSGSALEKAVALETERREGLQAQAGLAGASTDEQREAQFNLMGKERGEYGKLLHGLSTEEMRGQVRAGAGDDRMEVTYSRRTALEAAQRSGRKGATLQTLATTLGGELDSETAARLYDIKGAGAQAAALKSAIGSDSVDVGRLTEVLEKLAGKDGVSGAVEGLEGVATSQVRKELIEKKKDQQNAQADLSDPSYRKLDSMDMHLGRTVQLLGTLNGETRELQNAWKESKEPAGATT